MSRRDHVRQIRFVSPFSASLSKSYPFALTIRTGNYDVATWTTMEGTVKELHLCPPFVGCTSTSRMPVVRQRRGRSKPPDHPDSLKVGIKREDVKPGDPIKVRCHLLRDGSNGCLLGFVTPMHGDLAARAWRREGLGRRRRRGYSSTVPIATPR